MRSRHRAREIAFQIIYQYDLITNGLSKPYLPMHELARELIRHYDHFSVPSELREFVGQLVSGALASIQATDAILVKHTQNWKLTRMSPVDRSILRLATYEMLFLKKIAPFIIIDEAIELSKNYGNSDTPAFINGILNGVSSELL